jgi:hypothetical protein
MFSSSINNLHEQQKRFSLGVGEGVREIKAESAASKMFFEFFVFLDL